MFKGAFAACFMGTKYQLAQSSPAQYPILRGSVHSNVLTFVPEHQPYTIPYPCRHTDFIGSSRTAPGREPCRKSASFLMSHSMALAFPSVPKTTYRISTKPFPTTSTHQDQSKAPDSLHSPSRPNHVYSPHKPSDNRNRNRNPVRPMLGRLSHNPCQTGTTFFPRAKQLQYKGIVKGK